jgi:hypothetical protein
MIENLNEVKVFAGPLHGSFWFAWGWLARGIENALGIFSEGRDKN